MIQSSDALFRQLDRGIAPVYTICGDEPFLIEEAAAAVRAAASAAGYADREVMHAERGFDWDQLGAAAASMSLFGSLRVIELRLPTAKPGDAGSKALVEYCADPAPDTVLLIIMGKMETASRNSKWAKALDAAGPFLQCRSVPPDRLGAWIIERMRARGLHPHPDAVQLLVQRVEGNLLAASQEIEKLVMLHGEGTIDLEQVREAVADSARYDLFQWVDTAVGGDAGRALRMLDGMRAEGAEPTLVLWAIVRELRTLSSITTAVAQGESIDRALYAARVWESRKGLMRDAAMRLKPSRVSRLMRRAAWADCVVKGMAPGSPWSELSYLAAALAGRRRSALT